MPRRFIRHPTSIPIQLCVLDIDDQVTATADQSHAMAQGAVSKDVSAGGLSCLSDQRVMPGMAVSVAIFLEREPFEICGYVIWCKPCTAGYLVGIGFRDFDAAYALRMVEQVCHIEAYRQRVLESEGRNLTSEEAAHEWITQYAADFPTHPEAE